MKKKQYDNTNRLYQAETDKNECKNENVNTNNEDFTDFKMQIEDYCDDLPFMDVVTLLSGEHDFVPVDLMDLVPSSASVQRLIVFQ